MASRSLQLTALADFPLIEPGDDLEAIILSSLAKNDLSLHDGDVLVLAQKIVSKAENRYVNLADVEPDSAARDARTSKTMTLIHECYYFQKTQTVVLRYCTPD